MTVVLAIAAVVGTWIVGLFTFLLFAAVLVGLMALVAWICSEDGISIIVFLLMAGGLIWGVTYGAWAFGHIIMGGVQ